MAARRDPVADCTGLRRIGTGAGDIGDHQAAQRQPARDIGEIIGDRSGDALLGEQLEEAQAGVIMVVAGIGAGRKAARDDMRAVRCCFWHRVIPSVAGLAITGLSGSGRLGQLQASSPDGPVLLRGVSKDRARPSSRPRLPNFGLLALIHRPTPVSSEVASAARLA